MQNITQRCESERNKLSHWSTIFSAQLLTVIVWLQRFAAVIIRIREPKTTALVFASGKMVSFSSCELTEPH